MNASLRHRAKTSRRHDVALTGVGSGSAERKETRRREPRRANHSVDAKDLSVVLTIGHSTRTLAEFTRLLRIHAGTLVADVRTVPRSRHTPQFNQASLSAALKRAGLKYVHLPGLGGLRHAKRDSINQGWRNASFRGFADYMRTPDFEQSLTELIKLTKRERVALMCAEAVPWRCHRSLIADALLVRGIRAEDIMNPATRRVHTLTPFAKVHCVTITYPDAVIQNHLKKSPAKSSRSRTSAA